MSALNAFARREAAYLLTDGAGYEVATGCVTRIQQKVAILGHIPVAVSARGSLVIVPLVAEHIGATFSSFDAIVADGGEQLKACLVQSRTFFDACGCTEIDLVIAGWSCERKCGEIYLLADRDMPGCAEWQLTPIDTLLMPSDERFIERARAYGVNFDQQLDPSRDGLAVMNAQRSLQWARGDKEICAVGGFAQLTTVTEHSILTEIVHRWSDVIGERIDPN